MTLVEWLRGALNEHERIARTVAERYIDQRDGSAYWPLPSIEARFRQGYDSGITAGLDMIKLYDAAHVLRTVQAHREILDRHGPHPTYGWCCKADQSIGSCGCVGGGDEADWPCFTVLTLAGIYRDSFPGFDPSWIGETS